MEALPLGLEMAIYLAAAIVSVPLAHRLGLGSVIGYLIAGMVIGPFVLGIGHLSSDVMSVSEIGVVMMLFLVGLELDFSKLWEMRQTIIGLGGLQMILTTLALAWLAGRFGLPFSQALAVGLIMSFSSTAIVLPLLQEKGLLKTSGGQASFAVLLAQEMAVIPVLAFLPLLAGSHGGGATMVLAESTAKTPAGWHTLIVVGAVAALVLSGRFLVRPFFRYIAATHLQELFTASALLIVVGIILLMDRVGLDPAVGAFIGGVVLAESEYRHQIEADIAPFKGLLLGLFFVSVGASINFGTLFHHPGLVLSVVLGLMVIKFGILGLLGRCFKLELGSSLLLAFALAQGDEFAFVLIPYAEKTGVWSANVSGILTLTVTLSMALTPLLFILNEKWVQPPLARVGKERLPDVIDHTSDVLLVGFGRFGNIVGRLLRAHGVETTVLDFDAEQIETVRKLGLKAYYGDATRVEILRTAGAGQAKLLLLMIDTEASALKIVDQVKHHFPHLKILARATSRLHAYDLLKHGVDHFYHEMLGSALDLGKGALAELGVGREVYLRTTELFEEYEKKTIREMAALVGKEGYFSSARKHIKNLEQAIAAMKDFPGAKEVKPFYF
jgi:monovalent cation:proton antiporter-2 (CPA2) family protein